MKRRKEITVEIHRVVLMRRIRSCGSLLEGWCDQCGKEVSLLYLEDASRAGLSEQAISRKIESGRLHFAKQADEPAFVCLSSLLD